MGQFRQGQSPASAQEASGDVVSQVARDGAVGDTLADEEDKSAGAFRTAGRSVSVNTWICLACALRFDWRALISPN